MIIASIILALAFAWLGIETDWLTIRLPYGKAMVNISADFTTSPAKIDTLQCPDMPLKTSSNGIVSPLLLSSGKVNSVLLLDTYHIKPTEFTTLDMPDMSGSLNVLCKRG